MEDVKVQYNVDLEILTDFLDESEESITTLDNLFVELEQLPKDKEIIGSIFQVAHSIKGLAAFLNLNAIKDLTHNLENVLDNLRNDKLCINSAIIDCLLKGFDEVSNMLTRVRAGKSQVEDENKLQKLLKEINQLSEDLNIHDGKRDISKALDDVTNSIEQISEQVEELGGLQDEIPEEVATNREG